MPDPLHPIFALAKTIRLTDGESHDIRCHIFAFVQKRPVTAPCSCATALSEEERDAMFQDVYTCMQQSPLPEQPLTEETSAAPQIFDQQGGTNLLHYLKPFFLNEID